jgi:hypothetical protein
MGVTNIHWIFRIISFASGGRTNDDSGTTMIRRRRMDATCLKLSLVTGRYSPAQTEITDLRQLVRKG